MVNRLALSGLIFVVSQLAVGQSVISPYSSFGIGEISNEGLAQNDALGGTGIGLYHPLHINVLNPSMLTSNVFSSYQIGIPLESRVIQDGENSTRSSAGSIGYIVFAWPIVNEKRNKYRGGGATRLGLMMGAQPFSSANYQVTSFSSVDNEPESVVQSNSSFSGGLTKAYIGTGMKLFGDTSGTAISFGAKVNYIFGRLNRDDERGLINDELNARPITTRTKTFFKDATLDLGLSFTRKYSAGSRFTLGLAYNLPMELKGDAELITSYTGTDAATDSLVVESARTVSIAGKLGIGASWQLNNKWIFAADYERRLEDGDNNIDFSNSSKFALGVEWIPDYRSVKSYWSRVSYRMGFRSQQLPYLINGQSIRDNSVTLGLSLPLMRYSSTDFSFSLGSRGGTSNNLVQENYFKMTFGVTINDRWFVRRKYN